MKTSRQVTIWLLALICTFMVAGGARPAMGDDLKIGICNPLTVAMKIQENKDLLAKGEADKKTLEAAALEKQEKLKALKADMEILVADSPEYAEKNQELLKASIDYEVWQKMSELDAARKQKNDIRRLFDKIQTTTQDIAKQKGLILVMADRHTDLPENLDSLDLNQLEQIIMQRTVLYADPKLDITGDVILAMDSAYANKH